jgi:hypothetical protein
MITFSSKIVNYSAIALFFYLLYASFSSNANSWHVIYNDLENQTIAAINSGRPISEFNWAERILIWYFKDKALKKEDERGREPKDGNNS